MLLNGQRAKLCCLILFSKVTKQQSAYSEGSYKARMYRQMCVKTYVFGVGLDERVEIGSIIEAFTCGPM